MFDEYSEKFFKELLPKPVNKGFSSKFGKLTAAITKILNDYTLVAHLKLNITDIETLKIITYLVDAQIQYHENREGKKRSYEKAEEML